jgi:hypothetical protein
MEEGGNEARPAMAASLRGSGDDMMMWRLDRGEGAAILFPGVLDSDFHACWVVSGFDGGC